MIYRNNGLKVLRSWKLGDDCLILAARVDLSAEAAESSRGELTPSELTRAGSFAFEHDRRRFAIARAGLRCLLAAHLNVPAASVALTYLEGGKPTLAGRFADSGLRFNLSHTADVVVYALAWNREIGIDIEHVRTLPNAASIAARFFSADELSALEALAPDERSTGFFRTWTRKEAFAKALGTGLNASLNDLDVSFLARASGQLICVRHANGERSSWPLHDFQLEEGLIGACVVSAKALRSGALQPKSQGWGEPALCS